MTVDAASHLPPQSLEAEEAILGAVMMSPTALESAIEKRLAPDHFYRPSHRTIYSTVLALAERDAVDELTVVGELRHRRVLGEVGGAAAIMTLAERVPSVANAKAYIDEVINQSKLRGLVETGHAIAKLGYEHPDTPDRLIDQAGELTDVLAERGVAADEEWTTLDLELVEVQQGIDERRAAGTTMVGMSTGFDALDVRWGGLHDSRLYIGAGRPGMGKSAWLGQVAEHIALDLGEHVALFNFEMNPEQQAQRTAARRGDVDLHRITNGLPTQSDVDNLAATNSRLLASSPNLHINRFATLTAKQIVASCVRLDRRLRRTTGRGLRAVGIDYLQLVESSSGRSDQRTNDVTEISRALKKLAMLLKLPVIALSQLNRSVEGRTPPRPNLSDLRESGAIEQDADVVLLLYRPEYYLKADTPHEWQGKAEAITAKWRSGNPGTDLLGWDGPRTKFVHARDARLHTYAVGGNHNTMGDVT